MSDTVAEIDVVARLNTKDYYSDSKKLEKDADGLGKSLGSSIGGGLKTAATIGVASLAALTAGAIAFGKSSISAFNEANEAAAKFEQIAANNNWAAEQTSQINELNTALQKTGVVEADALTAGQAQLGTFMLTAESVKTLTPALADLVANQKGYAATADDAQTMANLLGKVMTGNAGALSKYGVTLTDAQKKTIELGTEQERAAAIAEIMQQNFGGVNEALGQTPQGKITQLSNEFGDLQEAFGAVMLGQMDIGEFDKTLESFIDSLATAIPVFLPTLVSGFVSLITSVADKLPEIVDILLPPLVDGVVTLINSLAKTLPTIATGIITALVTVFNALIAQLPALITTLLPPLIKGFVSLVQAVVTAFPSIVQALMQVLPEIIKALIQLTVAVAQALPQIITALTDALPTILPLLVGALTSPQFISAMIGAGFQLFMAMVNAVPMILVALVGAFGALFANLWNGIKGFATQVGVNMGNAIAGALKAVVNSAIGAIEGFLNTPINGINALLDVINDVPGVSLSKISTLKFGRMAQGGRVDGIGTTTSDSNPTMLSTDEFVIKASSARNIGYGALDYINQTGMLPSGGGGAINQTNNIYNQVDMDIANRELGIMAKRGAFSV